MEWEFDPHRFEWIDEKGVGHYDPFLNKFTSHGCNGNCGRDDFPGKSLESTLSELRKQGFKNLAERLKRIYDKKHLGLS